MSNKVNNTSVGCNKCHVLKDQMGIFIFYSCHLSISVGSYQSSSSISTFIYPFIHNTRYLYSSLMFRSHLDILQFQNRWAEWIRLLEQIYCLSANNLIREICRLALVKQGRFIYFSCLKEIYTVNNYCGSLLHTMFT